MTAAAILRRRNQIRNGGPVCGGGGAASPWPIETWAAERRAASTGRRGSGIVAKSAGPANAKAPPNAHGFCSPSLCGFCLCSLPSLSIQTVSVSKPVQSVSWNDFSPGIQPVGTASRTTSAKTTSRTAKRLTPSTRAVLRQRAARHRPPARPGTPWPHPYCRG